MRKWAGVDFKTCNPSLFNTTDKGICRASEACSRGLLEQEETHEAPVLLSARMCTGCGDCVKNCPLSAVWIVSGF